MAKNNHGRIQGFNTFHLVQRKNYDLYCSCVCCSSQHHTNSKTKLSNRAGLSFFYGTNTVYNILLPVGVISRIALQSLCHRYSDRSVSLSTLKSPSFVHWYCCTAVLIYVRKVIRMNAESSLRIEFTISSHFLSSCLGLRVLGSKPNQSSRPGNSNTATTFPCKHMPTRQQNRENLQIQQDSNSTAVQV